MNEATCPTQAIDVEGDIDLKAFNDNKYAGCYSPCAVLTFKNWGNEYAKYMPIDYPAYEYCCQGPMYSSLDCMKGPAPDMKYTEVVHDNCFKYAWAYDYDIGLKSCPSDKFTVSMTFYDP